MVSTCSKCGTSTGTPLAIPFYAVCFPAMLVTGLLGIFLVKISAWFFLALLPLWFVLVWLFWEAPRWLQAIRNRRRPCPNCGEYDWKFPQYSGFGI